MSLSALEPPTAAPPRRRTLRLGRVTPVTDRQREVLRYVVEHVEAEGYPPSVREVCARFGWRSTGDGRGTPSRSWRERARS